MAKQIRVTLIDDITGDEANETVSFGIDGEEFEIDLAEARAKDLRAVLAPYVAKARRRKTPREKKTYGQSSARDRKRTQEIRDWAQRNGIPVSTRGKLSAHLVTRYEEAHKG